MLNKCVHMKVRRKKGQVYYYCTNRRAVIDFSTCSGCLSKEYKKVSKMVAKTPIKKVGKKRVTVSRKTYDEVYERCNGRCAICSTTQNLHLHHIDGRGKDKTDNPNNCIMLCNHCHLNVVHKNNKYWRTKLKEMI